MRLRRPLLCLRLLPLLIGAAIGCAEDDACDPETEIEVLYGSDQGGVPSTTVCEVAPATCGEQPDCACLEGQMLDNGLRLDFCLEEGSCGAEDDGVVAIVCPGG